MGSLTDTIETHQFGTSEIYTPLAPSTNRIHSTYLAPHTYVDAEYLLILAYPSSRQFGS